MSRMPKKLERYGYSDNSTPSDSDSDSSFYPSELDEAGGTTSGPYHQSQQSRTGGGARRAQSQPQQQQQPRHPQAAPVQPATLVERAQSRPLFSIHRSGAYAHPSFGANHSDPAASSGPGPSSSGAGPSSSGAGPSCSSGGGSLGRGPQGASPQGPPPAASPAPPRGSQSSVSSMDIQRLSADLDGTHLTKQERSVTESVCADDDVFEPSTSSSSHRNRRTLQLRVNPLSPGTIARWTGPGGPPPVGFSPAPGVVPRTPIGHQEFFPPGFSPSGPSPSSPAPSNAGGRPQSGVRALTFEESTPPPALSSSRLSQPSSATGWSPAPQAFLQPAGGPSLSSIPSRSSQPRHSSGGSSAPGCQQPSSQAPSRSNASSLGGVSLGRGPQGASPQGPSPSSSGAIPKQARPPSSPARGQPQARRARVDKSLHDEKIKDSLGQLPPCPLCVTNPKYFSTKSNLVRHLRNQHGLDTIPEEVASVMRTAEPLKECPGCGFKSSGGNHSRHISNCAAYRQWQQLKTDQERVRQAAANESRQTRQISQQIANTAAAAPAAAAERPQVPEGSLREQLSVVEADGTVRLGLQKVVEAYWKSKNMALNTTRMYLPAMGKMLKFWSAETELSDNDLCDFFAGSSDLDLPRLLPSLDGYLLYSEDHLTDHTLPIHCAAYGNLAHAILWLLGQYPSVLREQGRVYNTFADVLAHCRLMLIQNQDRIKRASGRASLATAQRAWEGESDPEAATTEEMQMFLRAYLLSEARAARINFLLDPANIVAECRRSRDGYCAVRDFVLCEAILTGGADRGEVAFGLTHRELISGQMRTHTSESGRQFKTLAIFVGGHKTKNSTGGVRMVISQERSADLLLSFATRITGKNGVVVAKAGLYAEGTSRDRLDSQVFLNCDGTPLARNRHQVVIDQFRRYANIPTWKRVNLHFLRHTFHDWGMERGIDLEQICRALNHSVDTGRRYRTKATTKKAELVQKFMTDLGQGAELPWEPLPQEVEEGRRQVHQEREQAQAQQRQARDEEARRRHAVTPANLGPRRSTPQDLRDRVIALFPNPDPGIRPPLDDWNAALACPSHPLRTEIFPRMRELYLGASDPDITSKLRESYRAYHRNKGGHGKVKGKGGKKR